MNIQEQVTQELQKGLSQKMDDIFIEGLRLKGYEFSDKKEIEIFISKHCRCEDYPHLERRTYFVKDVPFLVHYYHVDMNMSNIDTEFKITANNGKYHYV